MPEHEEHCLHSEKRYGFRGDEIHAWIDEPSTIAGGSHRNYRHDLNSLPTAIHLFGKQYGDEMVENIFLDHLKADSEENRRKKDTTGIPGNSKLWTEEEDNYLWKHFLDKTDDQMEADLSVKTKAAIVKRRKYLGLIRPKIIQRTRNSLKVQRLVFKLERGQKFHLSLKIQGGKNDIDFWVTDSQNKTRTNVGYFGLDQAERVIESKRFEFSPEVTDNYSFYFSNAFSLIAKKHVLITYHLEEGRTVQFNFLL